MSKKGVIMKRLSLVFVVLGCQFSLLDSDQSGYPLTDESLDINIVDESGIGAGKDVEFAERERFNVQKKREEVINLVGEIEALFKKKTLNEVMDILNHTRNFKHGELYPFAYSMEGVCLAHGEDSNMVWRDLSQERDSFGDLFVQAMIKKARDGGGWHTYQWRDAAKVAYVKMVVAQDGQQIMIGSGFYPHSKEDQVISLVKGAVSFFNENTAKGMRPVEIFGQFNYQLGDFILGDLYIYATTKDVLVIANGNDPGQAGQSYYDMKDDKGVYIS
jgi:hypothetical protein